MKTYILFALAIFFNATSFGQDKSSWPKAEYQEHDLVAGVLVSESPAIDLGYNFMKVGEFHFWGAAISMEQYFVNDYKVAPKVRAYFDFMFIMIGASIPWYFDMNGHNAPRFRPEIGFSNTLLNIYYSPNIKLTSDNLRNIATNNLTISFNIEINSRSGK